MTGPPLLLTPEDLPQAPPSPFHDKLNEVLRKAGSDEFVEGVCAERYHRSLGRPSLPPGVYFRLILLGYLLGLDSGRQLAALASDSLSMRAFLGYGLHERTPDHSTLARTRRRLGLALHEAVLQWVLQRVGEAGLVRKLDADTDSMTLQAIAALDGLRRKGDGAECAEYLQRLAAAGGRVKKREAPTT